MRWPLAAGSPATRVSGERLSVVIRCRVRPAEIVDEVAVGGAAMRAIPSREAGPIAVRGHFGDQLHRGVTLSADLVHRFHASHPLS